MFKSATLLNFTTIFRAGDPLQTDAVVHPLDKLLFQEVSKIPPFEVIRDDDGVTLSLQMKPQDRIFGLGENLGGLNKRGKAYRLYAKDESSHTPEKSSLYGSHPFCMIDGESSFGIFVDYPSEIVFDVGFSRSDLLSIRIPSHNFDLYIFQNEKSTEIVREFLRLTGAPYVPPKWAFGFQQCRYSYPDASSIRSVAENFRKNDIPCDAIYMDIDYMQDYKIFTVDQKAFPRFESFVKEMGEQGFKLVPIIDPGVKVEEGYSVYEDGKKKGFFCVDKDGKEFVGSVWPGSTHFPDFLNPDCRLWWGNLYKDLVKIGINSYWNDMNEPAIFFTPAGLKELADQLEYVAGKEDLGKDPVDFLPKLWRWWHSEDTYKQFYHKLPQRSPVCHHDVHNLYGFNMARASAEGLRRLSPNERYFMLSRSSYIGLHRYAVVWTGDNHSWWEHLLVHMRMIQSLNMAGFFYCGSDVGGFNADASSELVVRWMQLGAFTPLFRNHSTKGSRQQEPWAFDDEALSIMREVIKLRYAMIPYAYSEFLRAVQKLTPFISPLFMKFPSERTKQCEDQFMFGDSLMVAPVHAVNATGRYVHLPAGTWLHWKASGPNSGDRKVLAAGDHYVSAELSEIPLFIAENKLIVLSKPQNYVGEEQIESLTVMGLVTDCASFTVIFDDGHSFDYEKGIVSTLEIEIAKQSSSYDARVKINQNPGVPVTVKKLHFEIYDQQGKVSKFEREVNLAQ